MSRGPLIRRVDANSATFIRTWKKLPPEIQAQAIEAFKHLLQPPDKRPEKLHFHKMKGYEGIWTIHISTDDSHKASLSLNGDMAVMRRVGTHEEIDRNPE